MQWTKGRKEKKLRLNPPSRVKGKRGGGKGMLNHCSPQGKTSFLVRKTGGKANGSFEARKKEEGEDLFQVP